MHHSPFAPTFGTWPPVLAGRADLEDEIRIALETGPRSEWYTTLLLGNRGTGKTVSLALAMDVAASLGFHAIYEIAHPGLIERLTSTLQRLESAPPKKHRSTSSTIGVPGAVSITTTSTTTSLDDVSLAFRDVLATAVDRVVDGGSAGILLAIDELHDIESNELATIGAAIQILARMNGQPIAFIGAGLPELDQRILDTPGTTFLERCARYDTGFLDQAASRTALAGPFDDAGIGYVEGAMQSAVAASAGHPFAIQSIGHHVWSLHADETKRISTAGFARGVDKGLASMGRQVVQPIWKRLSEHDQRFLRAMAEFGERDVPVSHLVDALERSPSWVSRYRDRLIKAAVIVGSKRGHVAFAHPAFGPWITEH